MESKSWADLPEELLALISDCLKEAYDRARFRWVCRSWRSSVKGIPNKLSSLLPHRLPDSWCPNPYAPQCESRPKYLIANAIYLLKHPNNASTTTPPPPNWIWMTSVQESKPGKLLLLDPFTHDPISLSSGYSLDLSSCSLTQLAISHTFHFSPTESCSSCNYFVPAATKLVFVPNPDKKSEVVALYCFRSKGLRALRLCLSTDEIACQLVAGAAASVDDFVNFNGCIYVVDAVAHVYVLDHTRLQLLPLTCANFSDITRCAAQRFVVSDGDLYLVINLCERDYNYPHECQVYRFVRDDVTCFSLERVEDLGERVFFINRDCSFSVSTRDLPPPLVGNRILVDSEGFSGCHCFKGLHVYHLGGMPPQMGVVVPEHYYSVLFTPPSWIHQLKRW